MTRMLALTFFLVAATFGQPPAEQTRTFRFVNTTSAQEIAEIVTAVRSAANIKHCSVDVSQRTVLFGGTSNELSVVEWLLSTLDNPSNAVSDSATLQYQPSGNPDEVYRVFYLRYPAAIGQFQEVATVLRSVTNVRRLFIYNRPKAIVLYGTSTQIAMLEWLVKELDQPLDAPAATQKERAKALHEYRPPGTSDEVVRVFYLPETETVAEFQKIVTSVRTATNVRRAFTYNGLRAVVLRDTEDRITAAERMFADRNPVAR